MSRITSADVGEMEGLGHRCWLQMFVRPGDLPRVSCETRSDYTSCFASQLMELSSDAGREFSPRSDHVEAFALANQARPAGTGVSFQTGAEQKHKIGTLQTLASV